MGVIGGLLFLLLHPLLSDSNLLKYIRKVINEKVTCQVLLRWLGCLNSRSLMSQPFPAIFIADSLGLAFLNSVATPVDVCVDWIDAGEGLLAWLDQAQLGPPAPWEGFRAAPPPG